MCTLVTVRALAVERSLPRAFDLLRALRGADRGVPTNVVAQIDAITPADLQRVAQRYLAPHRAYVAKRLPMVAGWNVVGMTVLCVGLLALILWIARRTKRRAARERALSTAAADTE